MRALLAVLVLASAAANAQTERDIFAQRALARALDDRCELFSDNERLALDGAYLQARGDLLRNGIAPGVMDITYEQISRNAANQPCSSDATLAVANEIKFAFLAWQRERFQEFVGAPSAWSATRPFAYDSWVIHQQTPDSALSLRFGVYNREHNRALAVSVPDAANIAALAITMRDPAIAPDLHDPSLGGLLSVENMPTWTVYLPPESRARRFVPAVRRSQDGLDYFEFGADALSAFSALDPREAVLVEAFDRQGRRLSFQYVGVGDFAAALAFVRSSPDMSSAG